MDAANVCQPRTTFDSEAAPRRAVYRPLVSVASALACGVAVDWALQDFNWGMWPIWGAGALGFAAIWRFAASRGWAVAGWLALGCVACVGGGWRHLQVNYFSAHDLSLFARQEPAPICLEAVLCETPFVTPAEPPNPLRTTPLGPITEATIEASAIRDGKEWRPCHGLARLKIAGELPSLRAGDRVRLYAKFGRQSPPLNPHQLDWRAMERSRRRLAEVYCSSSDCVTVVAAEQRLLARQIGELRTWCRDQLVECVGPSQAPLALAVVLGVRQQLDDSSIQAFFHTGTIHLLVVSGMHVGMLAGLAWSIARCMGMSQRSRTAITAGVVLLFAAVTGPHPSVIRSTLLVLSLLGATATGRRASRLNLLAAGALAVIAYNPDELFRAGTQLSFLSAAALLAMSRWMRPDVVHDPLEQLIRNASPWPVRVGRWCLKNCAAACAASLVVWLATLPLVGTQFHIATPIGIAMTPLVWPLVGIALAAGLGVLTIGWLLPPLDDALGALVAGCLHLVQNAIALAECLPGGHLYGPGPPNWWLAIFYAGIALVGMAADARPFLRTRWALAAGAWLVLGGALAWGPRFGRAELKITFLAMGHGVAVVLELPRGQTLLYDAGSLGSPTWAARSIAEFLWGQRITRIDAVLLSHADIDHFNGLPSLVDMFRVGRVCITPQMAAEHATHQSPALDFLFASLSRRQIPIQKLVRGEVLSWEDQGVALRVLHPADDGGQQSDNASSMVVVIEYAGRRILLPGDLESSGIDQLTRSPRSECDVLLAPHHGSLRSNPTGFAAWCTPEWTIVSGDRSASAATLRQSYARQGGQVWSTAERGAIEVRVAREGVHVEAFLADDATD